VDKLDMQDRLLILQLGQAVRGRAGARHRLVSIQEHVSTRLKSSGQRGIEQEIEARKRLEFMAD
jgi:hypothetical protein